MVSAHIRIAISGASGRMGRQLIRAVNKTEGVAIGAAVLRSNSSLVGSDAGDLAGIGALGITMTDNLNKVIDDFDILIDFTHPESTLKYLDTCIAQRKAIVIGTTGFDTTSKRVIHDAAQHIGIVFSANFSVGINLILKLLEKTAQVIGHASDIEIIDAHHRNKLDAPSGTALSMGEVIAKILGNNLKDCAVYSPERYSGERNLKRISFTTIRAGDIIGEHKAMFVNIGERVEITHKVSSRMIFANGAVQAACWLYQHNTGLFDMNDVLNLNHL